MALAFLAGTGRDDEAVPIARRAMELDPISVRLQMNTGIIHFLAWRFDDAAAEFRRVIERDPNFVRGHIFLGCALAMLGRSEEAIASTSTAVESSKQHPLMLPILGACTWLAGRRDEALVTVEPVLAGKMQPIYAAMAYAVFDVEEAMFRALERGYAERSDGMYSVGRQPWFRPYHSHPRFLQLLHRMRLARPTAAG